jgi:Secretion system C-terminal sorting domain/Photosynthesis system II assembly factor YCF48
MTLSSGKPYGLSSISFPSPNMGFAVGSSGTILKTTNSGVTWTTLPSRTINNLYAVNFADTTTGYTVGDTGTILNTTNSGGFPVGLNDFSIKTNSLKIYPIPTSSQIIVETKSVSTKSQLSILNLNGQTLITYQITEPSIQIDITSLPSRVYFVRLTNDRTVKVGKIIKQ